MTGPGRAGLAAAAVTALAATFFVGVAVGGSPTATPPGEPPGESPPQIRLVGSELRVPDGCEELLASYVERGVEQVGPWGWGGPMVAYDGAMPLASEDSAASGAPRVAEQSSSATGTNVQEAGVDEPDVVKTDGELLVRARDGELEVHDVSGAEPEQLAEVDLPGEGGTELLLVGDQVVAVSAGQATDPWLGRSLPTGLPTAAGTRVTTYDLSDPRDPTLVDDRSLGGGLVRAVQHGEDVRLVVTTSLPDLDFVEPRFWRSPEGATERNRDVVRDSAVEDWLPTVTTYDADGEETGTTPLLGCDDVVVPADDEAPLGTVAVVGFDADEPGDPSTFGIATDTRLAYFSETRMYLASSPWSAWGCCWGGPTGDLAAPVADLGRTRIHAFALDGTGVAHTASGVVDGIVEDRWSMDEHDGVLRVAVGPSTETGNFSSVLTLAEDGQELAEVGRVDKLGVDEEIKAVRWFDDLAIVVTFRQVDPLYAVDLADPEAPRLLGELKIPGYSEYLHPIAGDRLIGVGQDATLDGRLLGAQAALFDVSDLTDPRRTDTVHYRPGSVAGAATDPRQFTWLPDRGVALAVVSDGWSGRTGWVSVLTVDGDRLERRMIEVEHGSDVDRVRTLPLPDGRVVLVTGGDVSFLDL